MENKRIDIMVDIETLGNQTDSTVFQIAGIAFDMETNEMKSEFNYIADIELNENPINVTGSTIKWWLKTNKDLFEELLNSGYLSSETIVRRFFYWIEELQKKHGKENVYLWGNGILFDNKIIQHQMESVGLKYPIFYKNDRDVRTILEVASLKSGLSEQEIKDKFNDEALVAHNALDDVIYQIDLVRGCYKLIMKGSM